MGGDVLGCREGWLYGGDSAAWVRQAERDRGERGGLTSDERARLKALERENRELRQANEILRKASAYFAAAELDRRSKP
jgi:transposase